MEQFRISFVQMTSTDRVAENLKVVIESYKNALADRAQLVVFPENTLFFRIQSGSPLEGPAWDGPEFKTLADLVSQHKAALLLTSALKESSGKFKNTTVLFEAGKAPRAVYSKVHLFDVDVAGAPPVRESDYFSAGDEPAVLQVDGWKFGLTICYDLRFPELFLRYAQNVDCILVPSAFLVPTGEAHWQVLLRARAIESQSYVIAPAQAGEHVSGTQKRSTYGHSLAIDPWGRILSEMAEGVGIQTVTLSKDQIGKVRRQIPMAAHRRLKPV